MITIPIPRRQKSIAAVLSLALLAAACGGGATAVAPTEAAKVTASGFVCPEPRAKMEVTSKEVNLFVWTEYIPQDIIDCFELVYGVKVNRDEFSSIEEMYAKFIAGGVGYDVVHASDNVVEPLIRQGKFQKLDKSNLPVMANFDPTYLNLSYDVGNLYTIPYEAGTDALLVNTGTVENVPDSWEDLWSPEYAGRIVSIDDSRAVIGLTLLTLGYDVNTTDAKQLEEAKGKLAGLIANIKVFDSDSPKSVMIAGDADIGIIFSGEAILAQRENPALQYVYPAEGAIVWQDNYAIPTDAPHTDAAYAWLNYSMQDNLFWLMLRDFPYINPNRAALDFAKSNTTLIVKDQNGNDTTPAELYAAYVNSTITNAPADAILNASRVLDVGDALPIYDQIWTEVKGK